MLECAGEVDGDGRFTDATFTTGNGNGIFHLLHGLTGAGLFGRVVCWRGLLLRVRDFHPYFDILDPVERTDGSFYVSCDLLGDRRVPRRNLNPDLDVFASLFNFTDEPEGNDVAAEAWEFDAFEGCLDIFCFCHDCFIAN